MDVTFRTCTDDDVPAVAELVATALLSELDDEALALRRLVFEPDRNHVAVDGDDIVASAGVFTREMTVPGASVPVAHVTGVGVAATHRRRGLLTGVMSDLFAAAIAKGDEPIAALWASEGAIYGRYGYGLASWNATYDVATAETAVPGTTPHGRLRAVVPCAERDAMAAVHERARLAQPGLSERPGGWWERRVADPASRRNGMSAERAVLYEVDGRLEGYAMWRTKGGWGHQGPTAEAVVTEVVAPTTEAYLALWRFLLSIDLIRSLRTPFGAVDDPLAQVVTNASALGRSIGPGLWVRVLDVRSALTARRYATPVSAVIEVTDARLAHNEGRWRLTGDRDGATCESTTAAPDLTVDVRALGASYLGGMSLTSLAAAGLVTENTAGAVSAVSTSFGWDRAPWSQEMF